MNAVDQQELMAAAAAEQREIDGRGGLGLEVDAVTLLGLVGACQLALRHPEFGKRPTAERLRKWIGAVQEQMGQAGYGALAQIMQMGFQEKFDRA